MSSLATQIADLSSAKLELLAQRLREKRDSSVQQPTIPRRPESAGPLPLSFAQQRLWFLDQLVPNSPAYNVPTSVRLSGPLNPDVLQQTFTELLRRHEILRTSFPMRDDQPHQLIAPPALFHLPLMDLARLAPEQREAELQLLADQEAQRPFDLERGPLLRAALVRLADDDHALLFTTHHIVSDGWSIGILIKEISTLYAAFAAGAPSPLPELPLQYADYAVWQRERLSGEVLAGELAYWRDQLGETVTVLDLPTDHPRPSVQTQNGARYGLGLSRELSEGIKELSERSGTTLFMMMLAVFQVLLSRHTGQEEIAVGTPIAGRNRAETEPLIGFFINTLVLRTNLSGDPSFTEFLERVRVMALGAYAHQDLPFEKLVEELQPERDAGRSPLFQVMMVLQNTPRAAAEEVEGLQLRMIETGRDTTQFDLVLNVSWGIGELQLGLEYNTDLFELGTIQRMLRHFNVLLESLVSNPEQRLSELQLVTPEERDQVLVQWNNTASEYPQEKCIHQVFEEQVERTPGAVAVLFEDKKVTYQELNERANRLAHHLQRLGVGPETLVGICVERSVEMVVGLLGILKAGGVYVPIDPGYPLERQAKMLEQGPLSVLVTQEEQLEKMPAFWGQVVCLEDEFAEVWGDSKSNPESRVSGENLAYVIYTSGSTGQPKGAEVPHRGVLRLLCGARYVDLNSQSCLLQLAPLSFDASTFELWGALLHGGRCVLSAERVPTPQDLGEMIKAYGVDTMWLTASLYNTVIDEAPEALAGLKQLLIGGEALSQRHVREGLSSLVNTEIINGYGPTEGTTFSCCYRIERDEEWNYGIPIGSAITNSQVYVLDYKQQVVPVGVVGELYIGGAGLARGYLREAELTAERFVPHPYSKANGERLYRTGDMVRYLEDGRLEFIGRKDNQVKVRGYRIELGEIETVLEQHGTVREAAVLAREDVPGEKRLVAYVVRHPESLPTVTQLLEYVSKKLPLYMAPSAIVMLEQMPLTPNGKIDRRALPAPEHSRPELDQSYVSPRVPTEEIVAGVWAQVLRVEQVGIEDDFFELGGHSLLATQVISRVRELFSVEIELRVLFAHPTVRGLGEVIEEKLRGEERLAAPAILPVARDVAPPLSFAQQRLWFLDQLEPGSSFYNIPAAVRLRGRLDLTALEQSFKEVLRRHELLRTRFGVVNGVPVQVIDVAPEFTLAVLDLSTVEEAEARRVATEESQRPFDLATGPLLRASVLRLSEQEHVLLCTMHHIISDGWSMGVLIKELTTLYEVYATGQQSPLPELDIQYADYAHWQREWLQGEVLEKQLDYWKEHLAGAPAVLELPTDYPRPAVQTFRGAHQSLTLPAELTTGLKALTQREGVTLFMTLLAAFQILLSRYSGQEDIVVSTGIANRNRAETEELIGFFVNTLVLRTDLSGEPAFAELLRRVREVTLGAYAHQDVPFELLVEALAPERDARYTPLFQVMLVLQNARVGEAVQLAGLEVSGAGGESGTAKFDLTLFVAEQGEELGLVLEYNTDLFARATIEQMLGSFRRLVEGIVAEPERSIGSFEMIDAEERRRLTGQENLLSLGELVSVVELFDAVAARNATAVAVETGERRLSYGALQERANSLANYLIMQGAGRNSIVALLVEDTSERIVGMLGSMKAGAAFMPLDVRQPAARLRKLLELAPPQFLLTETKVLAALGQLLPAENQLLKVMCVDGPDSVQPLCPLCLCGEMVEEHIHHRDTENTEITQRKVDPDQLSYIYFTSGSSGTPKAIAGRLKGIAHFINWEIEELGVAAGVRVSQLLSPSFDGSLRDIFLPLCVGGVVCVPERREQVLEGRGLVQWLEEARIEVLHCVPSVFRALVNEELRADELGALRHVVLAGEALVGRDVGKWKAVYGERVGLLNLYGTSETTMAKFSYRVGVGDEEREVMPIGKPMVGAEAYLLDERGEPCGRGMVGEIYIRTPYRSLGYYGQPELTAAVFVPNPFSIDPSDLVHKTGDMGRVLEDGNFEYLGRRDEQVKVRGARVELKEVENAVRGQAGVLDVAVIEREDGSGYTYLCAYLVLAEGVQTVEVAEGLEQELPDYMLPSAYVEMAELPRTISGKVDRRALPEVGGAGSGAEYVAARTPVEEMLVASWEQLLGRERVGIEDNFFRLGGHSLLATQVMSRVRESFGVEVGLRVLFEYPTVRGLGLVIEEQLRGAEGQAAPAIVKVTRAGELRLSFAQQRLWFLDQLEPGSSFYNIPAAVRLRGTLDLTALEQSFREVLRRHESLRTRFGVVNGVPVQLIDEAPEFTLPVLDLGTVEEAEARRVATEESQRPFDLATGPLLRASVLRLSEQEHVLLFTMHHIISDGWSMGVLIKELTTLYEAYATGQQSPLPELDIQYADYAHWQREWLQGEVLEKQLDYWKEHLAGAPAVLELPTDYPRPAVQSFRGAHQSLTLPAELTTGLKALTQREGVTLFMTLLAAFQILLSRYSGQEDIVVSTGIANRNRAETEELIGFFVNTLVLRTDLSGNPSFEELLRRVREVTLGAYAHQDVPFELLVEALAPERDARYTPLFQVMLVLQNARVGEAVQLAGLEVSGAGGESGTAKFDLTLFVEERGEELGLVLEYNTDLFAGATIEQMLGSFRRLVEGIVAEPERSIGSFEMIDAEERGRLSGRESLDESAELVNVVELFDAVAARNATAVAVESGERRLSYGALQERANTLANYLITQGTGRGSIVALLVEDTSERIVGILGTLKAGAAFMPLDVRQPTARLRKLLELAPPEFLLTESKVLATLGQLLPAELKVMCVDGPASVQPLCALCLCGEMVEEHIHHRDTEHTEIAQRKVDPDQLSYIYFTSGSSGTPKAIAGRLKGIAHFINWEIEELGVAAGVRVSQLLSPSFDGSLRDIFLPLCVGGVVCVPERREQVLEGRGLVQWLEEARIEVLHCVPSVFRALVNEELRGEELSALRHVVLAGEALLGRDVQKWKAVYGERVGLLNLYGTSETTMAKFSYRVGVGDEEREVMPIGKPMAGAEAYLLDERGAPCGRGMVGEIYIRTPYRSLGYYGQPELTAAVFVPNPFSKDASDLVHKTGDMGRVLEDGNYEYLGRRDEQVKVRGARVELKEVENAVRGQAGVLDVAVIEREDGSGYTYLCAYLVLAAGVQTVEVAEGLEQELPDYMLPSAYVEMAELPRTISGKVDRRALPEVGGAGSGAEYVAARTPVEEMLVASWERLLGRERIGIDDNFFRLGGHSLLATQVMSRVRESFGVEVGLRVLFEHPTVRGLGEVIEEQLRGAEGQAAPAIVKVTRAGELRLSFAQQRLWFLDQLEPGSSFYNIPAAVRLRGTLDLTALEQSFREVIRRHESLRTRFGIVNGVPVQLIDEAPEFTLAVLDLGTVEEGEREAEARRVATEKSQQPFDFSTGPLLRASVLRLSEQEHVLLCTMHHIISDGWSMGVLIKELTTLYEAYATGQQSPLPELTIQYADYAHWQREWLQGEVLEKQLDYWKEHLAGAPAVLELPTDYPRPAVQTFRGAHQSLTLSPELTTGLKALTQREGVTLFMTLLAAFQILLSRYSGQEDIVVSTGIANRNRAETEELIGFFVNTLVLRTDLSGNPSFEELLRRVREVTLGAYAHQDVPFELLVEALAPERDARYTPLFQVMLVLQNARVGEAVQLAGLEISGTGGESGTAKFDLTLFVEERGAELGMVLEYNTDLFAGTTIEELLESFRRLVEGIVAEPERSIGSITMIDADERLELIESWS